MTDCSKGMDEKLMSTTAHILAAIQDEILHEIGEAKAANVPNPDRLSDESTANIAWLLDARFEPADLQAAIEEYERYGWYSEECSIIRKMLERLE